MHDAFRISIHVLPTSVRWLRIYKPALVARHKSTPKAPPCEGPAFMLELSNDAAYVAA